jgi:hypothetical protein
VPWASSPFTEKTLITKEKEEKMGQINTMNSGNTTLAIAAIQETRWNKSTPQAFTSNGYIIYTRCLANNHEFGTAFLVDSKFNHMVKNFTPINERLCVIRIKGRFFN